MSQLKYKLITFFVNSVRLWHGIPSKKVHFEIKMCSFYYLFYRLRDGVNLTNISMQNLILIQVKFNQAIGNWYVSLL